MPVMSAEEALRLRREALARKLTGGRRTSSTPVQRPITPPVRTPEMDAEVASRAAEALRLRHEAAITEARRAQLRRYLETGKVALANQDFAGAANAYRLAASLEPDDPAVQATCNEAMRLAATALADGYWKQAVYEEGQERWAEAALSYSKVCAGRPDDAAAHERVAFATLRSSTNIRRAVEFARKAVELSPRAPEMRITLARAYAAAGLDKSKHGELDRAVELGGDNPRVQAMVAQVRALAPKDALKEGKAS
jgi:tetratricopeptide (TPR) repeat protein